MSRKGTWQPLTLSIATVGGVARRRAPYFRRPNGEPYRKVGILGSTASLQYAPWADPSWCLVAHPCCRAECKREPDWYFDLHRRECFTQSKRWNPRYHTWLQTLQTPIFMQEDWDEIPMAVRYPLERMEAEFATAVTGDLFATNHCAYMFALAMSEGVETIGLFGCQYAGAERGTQRESLIYWMGRFEQAGGRLVVPRKYNSLLTMPLYGYASHDERGKLVPVYRPPLAVETTKKDGTPELRTLSEVDPQSAEGRIPLMTPPTGEPIAWERSGHAIHA